MEWSYPLTTAQLCLPTSTPHLHHQDHLWPEIEYQGISLTDRSGQTDVAKDSGTECFLVLIFILNVQSMTGCSVTLSLSLSPRPTCNILRLRRSIPIYLNLYKVCTTTTSIVKCDLISPVLPWHLRCFFLSGLLAAGSA